MGSLPAHLTILSIVPLGKAAPVPKNVAAKGFSGFTEILLQKCVSIQLDPVKTHLADSLPINSYVLVGFAMIIADEKVPKEIQEGPNLAHDLI